MAGRDGIINFDFIQFSKMILATLDRVRVRRSGTECGAVNNPGATSSYESRVNALLRVFGFQRYYTSITDEKEKNIMEEYVKSSANGSSETRRRTNINLRDDMTIENLSLTKDQKTKLSIETIYYPFDPPSPDRLIFPLVWKADSDIPKNRLVAAPFDEVLPGNSVFPPRSLLEAIIEIRVNRFEMEVLDPIVKNFFASQFNFDDMDTSQRKQFARFYGKSSEIKDYSAFSLIMLKNFDLAMDRIVDLFIKTVREGADLNTKINFVPRQTVDGSTNYKTNNVTNEYSATQFATIEEDIKRLTMYKDLIESTTALGFDQRLDVGRSAQNKKIDFVKDNTFMESIYFILKTDVRDINEQIEKLNKQKKDLEVEVNKTIVVMDYLFGTTSGISMLDVFCLLWALFEIDRSSLLGLLTDAQFFNYEDYNEGRGFTLNSSRNNITESYEELERIAKGKYDLFINKVQKKTNNTIEWINRLFSE